MPDQGWKAAEEIQPISPTLLTSYGRHQSHVRATARAEGTTWIEGINATRTDRPDTA